MLLMVYYQYIDYWYVIIIYYDEKFSRPSNEQNTIQPIKPLSIKIIKYSMCTYFNE